LADLASLIPKTKRTIFITGGASGIGTIHTPLVDNLFAKFSEQDHKTIEQYWEEENALFARGSAGTQEEVAEMVYFLISDKASFCTGGHYLIDGGLLCQRFIPKITQSVTPYLPAFSSLAVALTVGIVVSHNADRLMTAGLLVMLVVMLHNLFGLGIGYLVGRLLRLQRPKCVALSIEVGMQNSGLATSLAVMHFAAFPLATIPGAVFSVWHNISGAIIARIYARFP